MAYATKYICEFDNVRLDIPATPTFTIEFQFKDYTGSASRMKGGAKVVAHSWDTDDPHATIKGSNLAITLINEGQSTPLINFVTTEDDGVKVRLLWKSQLMFEGYLVQDDCLETMVDYGHEINLTANDNLGLLKGVPLNHSMFLNVTYTHVSIQGLGGRLLLHNSPYLPEVGQPFEIINHPTLNGVYTPVSIMVSTVPLLGTYYSVELAAAIPDQARDYGDIRASNLNFDNKLPLLTLIQICLSNTGVALPINFYVNLHEEGSNAANVLFSETLIDPSTFLKNDDEYDDCYNVLEKILKRFNITLFQAKGIWNFVRWDELTYFTDLIPGFSFDLDFNSIGTTTLPAPINIGYPNTLRWVNAPDHRIFRPYIFDRERFNYVLPSNILRNANLQQLGNLKVAYTVDSGTDLKTVQEYEAKWWYDSDSAAANPGVNSDYAIRIVYDYKGKEIERYLVVANDNIQSYPIEANKGDIFTFSFSFRTEDSQPGNVNLSWAIRLFDGTTTNYVRNFGVTPGGWSGATGWTYNVPSGDDTKTWHSVEIVSEEIPYDGLLYMELIKGDLSGTDNGTFYKDIHLEYIPSINGSSRIIAHTHTSSQGGNIKLNEEEEIFIDTTPRNSIKGTLFRTTLDGLLQAKTEGWKMPTETNYRNLGEITTSETLNWRRYPRSIVEGTLVSTTTLPEYVSLLDVLLFNYFPGLHFIWGKLEIDYRNNQMTGTIWEMWRDSEAQLLYNYEFKYIYG